MSSDLVKIIGAITALLVALTGFWMAVSGGDSAPVPAVIIIRGSTLPDDGLSDSERDREHFRNQQEIMEAATGDD